MPLVVALSLIVANFTFRRWTHDAIDIMVAQLHSTALTFKCVDPAGGQKQGGYIVGEVVLQVIHPVDRPMYQLVTQAMLQYGRTTLTTEGMARYFMETVGIQPHHRLLYFGSEGNSPWALNDYQADTLLHGLQSVMVVPVVDVPRTEGLYVDNTTFTEDQWSW